METDLLQELVRIAGIPVCLAVVGGVVCRVDLLSWRRSKVSVGVMYVCMGVYSLSVLMYLLMGLPVPWYDAAGVLAMLIELVRTWRDWPTDEAPHDTDRAPLGHH